MRQLGSGTAQGLFQCLSRAMEYIGVTDWEERMIGLGCDGCSTNMGERCLRALLQQSLPWAVVFWCLAHQLELSLKDAYYIFHCC